MEPSDPARHPFLHPLTKYPIARADLHRFCLRKPLLPQELLKSLTTQNYELASFYDRYQQDLHEQYFLQKLLTMAGRLHTNSDHRRQLSSNGPEQLPWGCASLVHPKIDFELGQYPQQSFL